MATKYVLNLKAGTLHICDGCKDSKHYENNPNMKVYDSEDDVIKEHQHYVRKCKNCFAGR